MTDNTNAGNGPIPGQPVTPTSNLAHTGDRIAGRDVQAEKVAQGRFQSATTFIDDETANNNFDIVSRDGSRIHVGGEYQDGDVVLLDGMEVLYEDARAMGYVNADGGLASPEEVQESQDADQDESDSIPAEHRTPSNPEFDLLKDQIGVGLKGDPSEVIDLFSADIAQNGELSEAGLDYVQRNLGMNDQVVANIVDDMTDAGGETIHGFLNVGDGMEDDRIEFLVDVHENGPASDSQIVRKLWIDAATGKLSQAKAIEVFDSIYERY